jgi:hypothetical protein
MKLNAFIDAAVNNSTSIELDLEIRRHAVCTIDQEVTFLTTGDSRNEIKRGTEFKVNMVIDVAGVSPVFAVLYTSEL